MEDSIETLDYQGHKIEVHQYSNVESPREWDNLGKIICFHQRYALGDKHDINSRNYSSWSELEEAVMREYNPCVMLPLYLYDHSGLRMKIGSFNGLLPQGHAEWDSCQVGWILCTKETARKKYGKQRISKKLLEKVKGVLEGEIGTYDQYLRGDVYGYIAKDRNGDIIDSCWGFYDLDYMKAEAKAIIDDAT